MESTQQRAERELRRGAEFLKRAGRDVYPARAPAVHLTRGVTFTDLGALRRLPLPFAEHGRLPHQAPLAKGHPVAEGVYLPMVQAAIADTPAKLDASTRRSVSVPSFDSSVASQLPRAAAQLPSDDVAGSGGPSTRNRRALREGLRWPVAAVFDKPSDSYKDASQRLHSKYGLVTSTRQMHARQKSPTGPGSGQASGANASANVAANTFGVDAVAAADIGGKGYTNPFMNRFYHRQPNGAFYCGSGLAAPKVCDPSAQWCG